MPSQRLYLRLSNANADSRADTSQINMTTDKKRKTESTTTTTTEANSLADQWLANVKAALVAEPSTDEYEPPIDGHFVDYLKLVEVLTTPRPFEKYEVRLYPGIHVRYRPVVGNEQHDRRDFDDANMSFHVYFLQEVSDDDGQSRAEFSCEREAGSTLTESLEMDDDLCGSTEVLDAAELLARIRDTRAGITELGMCGAVFETATDKLVLGPFNRVFGRREADAEEGWGDFDPEEIDANEFVRADD